MESEREYEKAKQEEKKQRFLEGLNTYYKMKSEYEETNQAIRKKIIRNEGLSWREKRAEYKKLKPKCINCKRPVGTIFSNSYNPEENGRKLIAVCGDRVDPCPLNIVINLGDTTTYLNDCYSLEKEIMDLKNRIIKEKNDLIFGYISPEDAVKSFEEIKEDLNLTISNYELTLENFMSITDNKVKNNGIIRDKISIYQIIQNIKDYIRQYDRDDNLRLVQDAIVLYVEQLIPLIEKTDKLEFPYREIIYDEDDNTFHLIKKQYTIDDIETNFSNHEVGVEVLQFGLKKPTSKTGTKTKAKTQKQQSFAKIKMDTAAAKKPKLVIDDDEGEGAGLNDDEDEDEVVPTGVPEEIDTTFADGNGESQLFKAAQSGNLDQVRQQVEAGADVHKKTVQGETILYAAVKSGNLEVVTYLLDHGAESDINVAANWGFTPLKEAINKNYLEIAGLLRNKGAQ